MAREYALNVALGLAPGTGQGSPLLAGTRKDGACAVQPARAQTITDAINSAALQGVREAEALKLKLVDVFRRGRFFEGATEHGSASRRMLPELKEAERRLCSWGDSTRTQVATGLPRRWVTDRANEGGILAGDPQPPTYLSEQDATIDQIIARFPAPWQKTACSNWQHLDEPREGRAARAGVSIDTLKRRCEVIRWAVKIALEE